MENIATTHSPASNAAANRVIIAGISALILSVGLARFAYTPILPLMLQQAGLSHVAGGWLATFNYAGYIIAALIAASISSLERKFLLYRLGLLLALVTTAGMGMTRDVRIWALLRFVSGLSSTAGLLLASGLVLNWLIRHERRPELGLHFAGMGLGIMISGLSVALMSKTLDWAGQWQWLAVVGCVFLLPAWCWMPRPLTGQAKTADAMVAAPSRRWMRLLMASYFCAGFGYVISATFIVAILDSLPLFAGKGAWVWVLVGCAALPSSFVWDRVAQSWGQIPALLLAYAMQVISIVLPACNHNALFNLLSALCYGLTFVGIVSLTLTLIGRCFPANPAKAMARLTLSYGLAQIVAPAMAGYMAAATGSYTAALWIAAGMMVLGMFFLYALQQKPTA